VAPARSPARARRGGRAPGDRAGAARRLAGGRRSGGQPGAGAGAPAFGAGDLLAWARAARARLRRARPSAAAAGDGDCALRCPGLAPPVGPARVARPRAHPGGGDRGDRGRRLGRLGAPPPRRPTRDAHGVGLPRAQRPAPAGLHRRTAGLHAVRLDARLGPAARRPPLRGTRQLRRARAGPAVLARAGEHRTLRALRPRQHGVGVRRRPHPRPAAQGDEGAARGGLPPHGGVVRRHRRGLAVDVQRRLRAPQLPDACRAAAGRRLARQPEDRPRGRHDRVGVGAARLPDGHLSRRPAGDPGAPARGGDARRGRRLGALSPHHLPRCCAPSPSTSSSRGSSGPSRSSPWSM
jgi:hypothetical protein